MQSFLILLYTWLFSIYHVSVLSVDSIDEGPSGGSSVPSLLWAFPRNGEIITPSSCPELVEEDSIHYPLYFFGWFQPPNLDYEFPLALKVLINSVPNEVPITWRTHDTQGLHLIHQKVYIWVAKDVRTLDLVITLSDTQNRIFSDEKITVMLASCDDMKRMKAIPAMDALLASSNKPKDDSVVTSPNYNEYFLRRFLEKQHEQQEGKQKKKKLDFLEIGTSDFDTCIQAVDSMIHALDEEDTPKYTGISIDAISSYLNKLPNLKSVLKINSAVIPSAGKQSIVGANFLTNVSSYESNDDWYWESVYFIPDFVIRTLFSDTYYWLRGIAEVGAASPHSASYLVKVPASPALIIKEFIPTMKIGFLLSVITEYYPEGVNLLKVDIEGMDQSVIYDALLFYYHRQVSIQTASYLSAPIQQIGYKWPCVLFFETVTYQSKKDPELEMLLKELGYFLLTERISRWNEGSTNPEEVRDSLKALFEFFLSYLNGSIVTENILALNCMCSSEEITQSLVILFPEIQSIVPFPTTEQNAGWLDSFCFPYDMANDEL
jgi:hypothetical protein